MGIPQRRAIPYTISGSDIPIREVRAFLHTDPCDIISIASVGHVVTNSNACLGYIIRIGEWICRALLYTGLRLIVSIGKLARRASAYTAVCQIISIVS
jgi:hypothetical protein